MAGYPLTSVQKSFVVECLGDPNYACEWYKYIKDMQQFINADVS